MSRFSLAIAIVTALLAGPGISQAGPHDRGAAAAAAESFFRYHMRNGCESGQRDIAKRRPFLSARLYESFQRYFRAEARFRKTHPQEIYFYNGDPFTNSQEYPVWFALGRTRVAHGRAETEIRFYFGYGTNCEQRDNVVRLRYERGGWKVHDIVDSSGMTIQQEIADRIKKT